MREKLGETLGWCGFARRPLEPSLQDTKERK
jgi:hypothetical protein